MQDIKGDIGAVHKSLHKDPSSLYTQGIMQAKSGLSGAGKQLHWKFMKGFLLHVCYSYRTNIYKDRNLESLTNFDFKILHGGISRSLGFP